LLFYSLESNEIGESGATTLSDALRVNQSLEILKWVTTKFNYKHDNTMQLYQMSNLALIRDLYLQIFYR